MTGPLVAESRVALPRDAGTEIASGPLGFVGLLWLLSALVSESPLGNSLLVKAAVLALPLALSSLIVLLRPADGLALWGLGLTFLVIQTGFQFDVGQVRFSVLEGVIVVLLVALVWLKRRSPDIQSINLRLPGQIWLALFAVYSMAVLMVGWFRGDRLDLALIEFKGFLLYPLMTYVVVAAMKDRRILRLSFAVGMIWYLFVAGRGLWQFWQNESLSAWSTLTRSSADYGPINVYGITLMSCSLLMLGVALYADRKLVKLAGLGAAAWLFLGAAVAVSRTVWIAYGLGLVSLFLFGKGQRRFALVVILLVVLLLLSLPAPVSARIFQLSDSSSIKRAFYLSSGLHAAAQSWLFGWGWGNGYWYTPISGLIPSGWIPWYHNDYLNLWVQVGVLGAAFYAAYWARVLWLSYRQRQSQDQAGLIGYAIGSQAALFALLVSASFEHVLWRPDNAGWVSWMAGLMLASHGFGHSDRSAP